jgi:tetratricopeptide (TPR) repeat protein
VSARSILTVLGLVALGYLATVRGPVEASLDEAHAALREGRYEEAIEGFEKESTANPTPRLYRGWLEALRLTGAYDEALSIIQRFESREPASVALSNARGEILYETGRIVEAREAFEKSVAGKAEDVLTAELNLAVLLHEEGSVDEAIARFDRFIDVYNRGSNLSAEDLTAIAIACKYLGVTDHQLFKDALRALDEAKAKDPSSLIPSIRAGELFLEKYNSPDANQSFQEALAVNPNHPEALLGLAQLMDFDGSPEARVLTEKALSVNPRFVAARAFLAEQLLGLEDYEGARREVEAALEVNPVSPEALPILAAAELLSGNQAAFDAVEERALARNPKGASFYNKLSNIAVNNRLYREARDFAAKAVELDPRSFEGYGLLGLNQLRLGDIEGGKKSLERSFEGDPYNVWIKNTLDLMDTYPDYVTTKTSRFEIVIEGKESDLLSGYVERMAEEAYESLAERYQFRPETPIRIEVYPAHGDFSVRTLGLPGLGALGVCFGPVIAVDSPSARPKGQFNWASTLWHELAHTFTLGATDHKVPRWFSEGLSVLEERRARPGWGDGVSLAFLAAYKRGKLLKIAELNNGFMRPTYPQQIGISYYQASLVSELIERDFGFSAIRDMLASYRRGLPTAEVFQSVLKMELSEFDAAFEGYLKERFEAQANSLRLPPEEPQEPQVEVPAPAVTAEELRARAEQDDFDFIAHLETGRLLLEAGETERAEKHLERAKSLFPEYGEAGSPYPLLAQIHEERGERERAAQELQTFVDINENHYDAHVKLFEIYQKLGKTREAASILERAIAIYPFDADAHRKLAALYQELGRKEDVVVERRALVALTTDRAQGLYELALAYYEAGDPRSAKRALLRALEIAPGFKDGLALLLKLSARSEG